MTLSPRGAALGALTAVALLSLAASTGGASVDRLLDPIVAAVPGGDLTGHLLLMGACSFLTVRGFAAVPWRGRTLGALRVVGALLVLSLTDEASQHFLAARTCSWSDALANVVGILTFGALGARARPQPRR